MLQLLLWRQLLMICVRWISERRRRLWWTSVNWWMPLLLLLLPVPRMVRVPASPWGYGYLMTRLRLIVGFVAQTKKIFLSFFGAFLVCCVWCHFSIFVLQSFSFFVLEVMIFVFERFLCISFCICSANYLICRLQWLYMTDGRTDIPTCRQLSRTNLPFKNYVEIIDTSSTHRKIARSCVPFSLPKLACLDKKKVRMSGISAIKCTCKIS